MRRPRISWRALAPHLALLAVAGSVYAAVSLRSRGGVNLDAPTLTPDQQHAQTLRRTARRLHQDAMEYDFRMVRANPVQPGGELTACSVGALLTGAQMTALPLRNWRLPTLALGCFADGNSHMWRIFVRFPLPELAPDVEVRSATLHLYESSNTRGNADFFTYAAKQAWDPEALNWDTMPRIDRDLGGVGTMELSWIRPHWTDIDVRRFVQAWRSGKAPNNGLMITAEDLLRQKLVRGYPGEFGLMDHYYATSLYYFESPSSPDIAFRPYVKLELEQNGALSTREIR